MSEEELLLKRIKVIGDGEFTLLGTPDELIKEFHSYTQEKELEARMDENRKVVAMIENLPHGKPSPYFEERIAELQAQLNKSKGE